MIKHLYRLEYKGKNDYEHLLQGLGEIRYLPEAFSKNPVAICIWKDKVGTFMLGDDLFAFVVQSQALADNYNSYHEYMWENIAEKSDY